MLCSNDSLRLQTNDLIFNGNGALENASCHSWRENRHIMQWMIAMRPTDVHGWKYIDETAIDTRKHCKVFYSIIINRFEVVVALKTVSTQQ